MRFVREYGRLRALFGIPGENTRWASASASTRSDGDR